MGEEFKNLRIVDKFYQTSAFFPMPLTLIGTIDKKEIHHLVLIR